MSILTNSPSPNKRIEIAGRAWRVVAEMTTDELPPRAAELWRRRGVVARCEVRRPRGRRSYLANRLADGSFSRPWRGSLVAAN